MKKRNPVAAPEKKTPAMKKITYKGFTAVQSPRNHHVMIGKNGKMVSHAACDRPMTDKELRKMVDDYIALAERMGKKCSK